MVGGSPMGHDGPHLQTQHLTRMAALALLLSLMTAPLLQSTAAAARDFNEDENKHCHSRKGCGHRGQPVYYEGSDIDHRMQFQVEEAEEQLLETDGGSIRRWKDVSGMLTRMGLMDARLVTLKPQGLLMPQYANSHRILIILRGCARMGMMLPVGMNANIRRVNKGELIAVPLGLPFWMLNDGKEPCCFLTIANIREPMMHGRHAYEAFHLTGSSHEEMGGIMRGFSTDLLRCAFQMDEESVRRLVKSQKGVAIIRVKDGLELPRATVEEGDAEAMVDFSYHLDRANRDFLVDGAGELTTANAQKLPVLKLMDMAAACLKLDPNAMLTPGWSPTADQVIYCVRGSARVQVVLPNGKQACDEEMREGGLMMVPKNYPVTMQAGQDGFDAAAVFNCHTPLFMHLAGKNSIFRAMPQEVRMAAMQVGHKLDQKLQEAHHRHAVLLPPSRDDSQYHHRHHEHRYDEEDEEEEEDVLSLISSSK